MKKKAIFISPVVPAENDMGLTKRAFTTLKALNKIFEVTLLCIIDKNKNIRDVEDSVIGMCDKIVLLNSVTSSTNYAKKMRETKSKNMRLLLRCLHPYPIDVVFCSSININTQLASLLNRNDFEIIHVFRLKAVPIAFRLKNILDQNAKICLDIDDYESKTRLRYIRLFRAKFGILHSFVEYFDFFKFFVLEKYWIPQFSKIFVCSHRDKEEIGHNYNVKNIFVFPNAIPIPDARPRLDFKGNEKPNKDLNLLFVGQMTSPPNLDAVQFFVREIFPLVQNKRPDSHLHLVGRIANYDKNKFSSMSNVHVHGFVDDLSGIYNSVDISIVPIRTGGGTRIKILEAFSFLCPVVSTSIGAEGIATMFDDFIKISDTPSGFSGKILELDSNIEDRKRQIMKAYKYVCSEFSSDVVCEKLCQFYGE